MSKASVDAYFAAINKHPILSRKDERALADKAKAGCAKSRDELITANLRYVAKVAHEHTRYGLAFEDLMQEGTVGLVIAVGKFDPSRGYRLNTFATHWIRETMRRHVLRYYQPVTIAKSNKSRFLFFALKATRNRLGIDATSDDVAAALNVDEDDVTDMDARIACRGVSYEQKPDEGRALADLLADARPSPYEVVADADERRHDEERIADALAALSHRERVIVARRLMASEPCTLEEVGEMIGCSRERVRQLQHQAMGKLRKLLAA